MTADRRERVKTASTYQQRGECGRAVRQRTPRGSYAAWTPAPDRPDPVELLEAQAKNRQPDVVPLRYARMSPDELTLYASICGWALARAHARSGDRVQISAYLGKSERFDGAIVDFAVSYADQIERDHAALCAAVKSGKIAGDVGA